MESLIVTDWPDAYTPAAGEKSGTAALGRLIVYAADPTELGFCPGAVAIAFTVSVFEIVIGSLHCGEDVVGVVPSVVQ